MIIYIVISTDFHFDVCTASGQFFGLTAEHEVIYLCLFWYNIISNIADMCRTYNSFH